MSPTARAYHNLFQLSCSSRAADNAINIRKDLPPSLLGGITPRQIFLYYFEDNLLFPDSNKVLVFFSRFVHVGFDGRILCVRYLQRVIHNEVVVRQLPIE